MASGSVLPQPGGAPRRVTNVGDDKLRTSSSPGGPSGGVAWDLAHALETPRPVAGIPLCVSREF
jgi:hypothetical protein